MSESKVNTLIALILQLCEDEGATLGDMREIKIDLPFKIDEYITANQKTTLFKFHPEQKAL